MIAYMPLIKGFLRLTTRLCELQRICYGEPAGAPRSIAVEKSLTLSRDPRLKNILDKENLDEAVAVIVQAKKIKLELHATFAKSLKACLAHIRGYRDLVSQVEALREVAFNSDDLEHERKLLSLWEALRPGEPLKARRTKEWQAIGFQGDDPKTDFRGMGMLGLENLL